MDVLAWGNKTFDALEARTPGIDRFREKPAEPPVAIAEGEMDVMDIWAEAKYPAMAMPSAIKHYTYSGREISFRDAIDQFSDPAHYHPADTWLRSQWGWARVSTIMPGFDLHQYMYLSDTPRRPMLFETMAFFHESDMDDIQRRHGTLEEALAFHRGVADAIAQSWWTNLGGLA